MEITATNLKIALAIASIGGISYGIMSKDDKSDIIYGAGLGIAGVLVALMLFKVK